MKDDRWTTSNSAYGSFWRAVPLEPKVVQAPAALDARKREALAEESRSRLKDLFRRHNIRERPVEPDGNCQFRALADQLYGSQEHHAEVRSLAVAQLKTNPEFYVGFVPGSFEEYVADMSRDGSWGDHVTLQAAADALGTKIHVLTNPHGYITDGLIEVAPRQQKSSKVLRVSYWQDVHYNSVE
eukprot:TRINITY_DN20878_c0_g1_i1.p1 TRINITY_DN20878_c0_g1~~TRINITY_DN20878_c0_g1_i1.p1  ORF type:complete len:184 (-),score=35.63 TRINITY_DN20878_c0_g1_i1:490-1041(-)